MVVELLEELGNVTAVGMSVWVKTEAKTVVDVPMSISLCSEQTAILPFLKEHSSANFAVTVTDEWAGS